MPREKGLGGGWNQIKLGLNSNIIFRRWETNIIGFTFTGNTVLRFMRPFEPMLWKENYLFYGLFLVIARKFENFRIWNIVGKYIYKM